jgi:hypothetical protein
VVQDEASQLVTLLAGEDGAVLERTETVGA